MRVAKRFVPGGALTVFIIVCSIFASHEATAQKDLSKILISLDVRDKPLSDVLNTISSSSVIPFSYNPGKIPLAQPITYACKERSLTSVLDDLAAMTSIRYDLIENQIILRPDKKHKEASPITISGYVKDGSNGEALIGATVMIMELNVAAVSNGFGFFSLTVPKGRYTLNGSFLGFGSYSNTADFTANIRQDITLKEQPPLLSEVIVNDAPVSIARNLQVSNLNVNVTAVRDRPALFGESDVLKSLESVPGIKLHSDGSTFYYVRGGNRDQNLLMVDDAPIYNPSHMLGLFSVVIPDVISDINLYKGNMPASLGGRISSLLDVRTKKGNDQHFQAWGNVGLISNKLGIEGPIKKGKSSFLLSARVSRLKWFFHLIDKNITQFSFYDITAKTNFKLNSFNRVFFSFYTGGDNYFGSNSGIAWKNNAGTIRWNHTINERLFINTTIAASAYDYSLYSDVSTNTRWRSHIANFNLKTDLSYFVRPENEITFGVGVNGYNFNPGNIETGNKISTFEPVSIRNSSEFVAYGNHEIMFGDHFGVNYGVRLSSWSNTGESFEFVYDQSHHPIDTLHYKKGERYGSYFNAEPRFNINYLINDRSSFKIGFARNAQNIHLISNSTSPFTSLEVWLPSSINIKPQIANQSTVGYYRNPGTSGISFETEIFYKKMFHQIDYAPHAETLLNPLLERDLRFGNGVSYGIELIAKKDVGALRGLAGYTYSRSKRKFADLNQGQTFNAFSDRPHQISLMVAYDVSLRWTVGMNWNYSTGSPYSSPIGFYRFNDQEVPIYGAKNNDRLPDYHRMDASFTYKLNKNPEKKFRHSITFSVFNLYGRKNILFVNYNKSENSNGDFKIPSNLLDANRLTSQYYLFQFTPSLSYNFKWL